MGESRMLIDGKLVEADSGKTFDNVNPATEQVIGVTADGSAEDMATAVAAARRAFDDTDWATNHSFRRRCLEQLQAALVEAKDEFHEIIVAEAGSPVLLAYAIQADTPIDDLGWIASRADTFDYERDLGEAMAWGTKNRRVVLKEPIGVVGAITPWNFPLFLNLQKIGPALAMGNTAVLKPAPDTPWSATVLGRIIAEKTDIPAGVVNIVPSSDHLVGEALVLDPRVDMITFTGSTLTGRRIMANAAQTVKRVHLELGGKSACILLDDANLAAAVPGSAIGVCTHAGQGCAIPTRLLLPRSRYDEGVELATQTLASIAYGDPTDPQHLMGPLISEKQRQRVLGYIEKGKAEGARLTTGGGIPEHLPTGFYIEPTVFADVDPDATIAQEEIFGPVLAIIPYTDDDDAVRIANNSIYGLSGAVSSASTSRALSVARRIRTGTVSVNGGMWIAPDAPFGGYRQSGNGREMGAEGLEEYLETKTLGIPAGS
jgi:aldehyde dehydrogenase (NAD+)